MTVDHAPSVPHRNRSPYGWWIASYIQRMAWDDEAGPSPRSRCVAWENTIILQAPDREAAYDKAVAIGSETGSGFFAESDSTVTGHWVFEGLTSLLPIYEELEDGAEILWVEHRNRALSTIQGMVKSKSALAVFDDRDGCCRQAAGPS